MKRAYDVAEHCGGLVVVCAILGSGNALATVEPILVDGFDDGFFEQVYDSSNPRLELTQTGSMLGGVRRVSEIRRQLDPTLSLEVEPGTSFLAFTAERNSSARYILTYGGLSASDGPGPLNADWSGLTALEFEVLEAVNIASIFVNVDDGNTNVGLATGDEVIEPGTHRLPLDQLGDETVLSDVDRFGIAVFIVQGEAASMRLGSIRVIPEPATLGVLAGALCMVWRRRRGG